MLRTVLEDESVWKHLAPATHSHGPSDSSIVVGLLKQTGGRSSFIGIEKDLVSVEQPACAQRGRCQLCEWGGLSNIDWDLSSSRGEGPTVKDVAAYDIGCCAADDLTHSQI